MAHSGLVALEALLWCLFAFLFFSFVCPSDRLFFALCGGIVFVQYPITVVSLQVLAHDSGQRLTPSVGSNCCSKTLL